MMQIRLIFLSKMLTLKICENKRESQKFSIDRIDTDGIDKKQLKRNNQRTRNKMADWEIKKWEPYIKVESITAIPKNVQRA